MAEDTGTKQEREDFAAARRILVDKIIGQHPGLSHTDFNGVPVAELDTHAVKLAGEQASRDREAGARAAGMTVEDFDALVAARTQASQPSTPEQRTANLPPGRPAQTPTGASLRTPAAEGGGATGLSLIEQAAEEDVAKWLSGGGKFQGNAT